MPDDVAVDRGDEREDVLAPRAQPVDELALVRAPERLDLHGAHAAHVRGLLAPDGDRVRHSPGRCRTST
jgi:hypothetical protein